MDVGGDGRRAICWTGSAWSWSYEVWFRGVDGGTGGEWALMCGGVVDNTKEGEFVWVLPDAWQRGPRLEVKVRGVGVDGFVGAWAAAGEGGGEGGRVVFEGR